MSQLHPRMGRTVSAEWGEGLHEHLPLLSLAVELAKEGPGQGTQQREGFPASALRLPGLGACVEGQEPQGSRGRWLWVPQSTGLLELFSLPVWSFLAERGLHLGPGLLFLTAHCGKCGMMGVIRPQRGWGQAPGSCPGPSTLSQCRSHTYLWSRSHTRTHTTLSSCQRCALRHSPSASHTVTE